MQPRSAIDFVPIDAGRVGASREALRTGHTRLPVCGSDGGLDAPLGLVHVHDLLAAELQRGPRDLRELLRPLARVADTTAVTELLARMRDERRHMVLVADELGTTVGLVTLEDLLEELVGEIEDEFDPPQQHVGQYLGELS
jgi:CBS domain containing-hemolysin-like protein